MRELYDKPFCDSCQARLTSILNEMQSPGLERISASKGCNFYKKGQIIFQQGHAPAGLYCIHRGKVKLYKTGEEGKDHIVRLAKAGDILGYRSLISGESYSASAAALEESVICCIPQDTFFQLLETDGSFSKRVTRLLSTELRKAEEKIVHLAQKPVRERIAEALLILREMYGTDDGDGSPISVTLSREELANMVGTAIETLVRTLAEFKRERIIATEKKKIRILDLEALIRAAAVHD